MNHAASPSRHVLAPASAAGKQSSLPRVVVVPAPTQRETIGRLRERLHARLVELIAECDDAGAAVAEGLMEQSLGVPCFAMQALHARLAERKSAVAALHTQLAQLDAVWS